MLGNNGVPLQTYTNNEITEYAKVWTAFRQQNVRGNIESAYGGKWYDVGDMYIRFRQDYSHELAPSTTENRVDPMYIELRWRDMFPKLGLDTFLDKTYIGDGLPLCADLTDQHFLKKGATYILLGSLDKPRYHNEPEDWVANDDVKRFSLTTDSALYNILCNSAGTGTCQYEAKVVLEQDLTCSGLECDVETLRVLEVGEGMYYEYMRLPCAHQAFYTDVKSVQTRFDGYACGDPRAEVGAIGCCSLGDDNFYEDFSHYTGERATFEGARRRCMARNLDLCFKPRYRCEKGCDLLMDYWGTAPCVLQAKIGLDGTVAIVHNSPEANKLKIIEWLQEENKTFFRVIWTKSIHQYLDDYEGMCASLGCPRDGFDNLCLCTVEVENLIGFGTAPTREEVLKELAHGAFSPYNGWDSRQVLDLGGGVKHHSVDGTFTMDSVFEVVDGNGITRFRKNIRSTVHVGSGESSLRLSFRNPSLMYELNDLELRDAHYETDAALDHYFVSLQVMFEKCSSL